MYYFHYYASVCLGPVTDYVPRNFGSTHTTGYRCCHFHIYSDVATHCVFHNRFYLYTVIYYRDNLHYHVHMNEVSVCPDYSYGYLCYVMEWYYHVGLNEARSYLDHIQIHSRYSVNFQFSPACFYLDWSMDRIYYHHFVG